MGLLFLQRTMNNLGLVSFSKTFKRGGNLSLLGLAMIGGDYVFIALPP